MAKIDASVDDVATLRPLSQDAVVSLIQTRYEQAPNGNPAQYEKIHTRAGPVIVVINPLSNVKEHLYTREMRTQYQLAALRKEGMESGDSEELPPHIYEIVAKAFVGIKQVNRSQAIVINGESGAGKTETAKLLLEFLSECPKATRAVGKDGKSLGSKLLASSPVLEAFGNAKTLRNDNSSRFGKLIKLNYGADAALLFAGIEHYLLEMSRVVWQQEGEQGYHACYYVTMCAPDTLCARLQLSKGTQYRYLIAPDLALAKQFESMWKEVNESLAQMFGCAKDDEQIVEVWKIIAAVLLLGEIEVDEVAPVGRHEPGSELSETSRITAAAIAKLLGVSLEQLSAALCTKTIMKKIEPRTPREARVARDALAKSLYGRLFNVLVHIVNKALSAGAEVPAHELFIGMLDIFGSEVLVVNSFEQLLINYANDKLQYFFTSVTISHVIKEYEAEGIAGNYLRAIKDVKPTLKLIEGDALLPSPHRHSRSSSHGVNDERTECLLSLLDDDTRISDRAQSRAGAGSRDDKLLAKILDKLGKMDGFVRVDGADARSREARKTFEDKLVRGEKYPVAFVIVHFGAEVPYCMKGFCEKNADPLDKQLLQLMQLCHDSEKSTDFTRRLFEEPTSERRSIAFKFRDEMERLLSDTLERCNGHFIRCIKPNNERRPFKLDPATCTPQLESCGVKEAAEVAQAGFPKSMLLRDFLNHFLQPTAIRNATWDRLSEEQRGKLARVVASKVLRVKSDVDFVCGRTKIYFRHGAYEKCIERQAELQAAVGKPGERLLNGHSVPPTGVRGWRLRNALNSLVMKVKSDLKDQVKRQAMQEEAKRRLAQETTARAEAEAEAHRVREEEIQRRIQAAVDVAVSQVETATSMHLNEVLEKANAAKEVELANLRREKDLELTELTENALAPTKKAMAKLTRDYAELQHANNQLHEFKVEAEELMAAQVKSKLEVAKYKAEVAELQNIMANVMEEAQKYLNLS